MHNPATIFPQYFSLILIRWFLVEPAFAYYSKAPPTWLLDSPEAATSAFACEAIQEQGDAFYVPGLWAHAVLNEEETAAIAIEFERNDC